MTNLSFNLLIESINQVHSSFQSQSVKAVNMGLTIRNWCIGFYILEFEQNGEDRAKYGTTLVANIAQSIQIKGLTAPELSRCRQFYRVYPEILGAKTQELIHHITDGKTTKQIFGLATQELQSNQSQLISFISYTHFVELIKIDLFFYHRILKAHVLIELKVDSFSHAHVSQLVTYLNFYKQNMMEDGDNPPIGILLVTDKNTALVEYATANEKDRLFVSKYKLNLPSEQDLKMFIERELQGFDGGDA